MKPAAPIDAADRDLLADGALTVKQAVTFSGIGRSALFELMASGVLPWFRHGQNRMLPRRPLIEYLARLYRAHQTATA